MNIDKKQRILVVDDSRTDRLYLRKILLHEGYEVIEATDGLDALSILSSEVPDLILLDIIMPGIDGIEVAKRIKENDKTSIIPIVMVSSMREDIKYRVNALKAGADDFLNKPVDSMELVARVQSLLKIKAYNEYIYNYKNDLENEVAIRTAELQKAFKKIKEVSLEIIYRLTQAAVYKDEGTGAHIKRVSLYAAAIARAMGLKETIVENILYASPMHDIGKIGIPDHILLKTGKLNQDEWEIMKQHTVIGSKILMKSNVEFIQLGEIIALTHHEKWDGSGYSQGLAGTQIPLAGRITAIADAFDAIGSQRPYKKALPVEKSFEIIKNSRGTHFDPDVVDAFFSIKDEILAIEKQHKDEYEFGTSNFDNTHIINVITNSDMKYNLNIFNREA